MRISADELSQPISEDQPCGEDLEYDAAFQAMETALQSQDAQEMGDSTKEAQGPDWQAVGANALDLLGRTRDLRVFVNLAMAGLHTDGLPAFHQALVALNNCMDQLWETVHPQLDPDDDNDPMMRMNVLQNLDDYANVRMGLKRCPLVELKGFGAFSLHDIELATGAREAGEGEEVTDLAIIQGAFVDSDRDQLTLVSEAAAGALAEFARMSELWSERTGGYEQPGIDNVIASLREISRTLVEYAPAGTVAGTEEEAAAEGESGSAAPAAPGTINSPADVILALDRICDYYAKTEPSSPIPFILRRAQRLVSKSFYEILQDIAPDGITQFDTITGHMQE